MILHALEQALEKVIDGECDVCPNTSWSREIPVGCIQAAVTIMNYLIEQKLIMMDLVEQTSEQVLTPIPDANRIRKLLVLPVEDEDGHISPSKIAQKHICAPTDGKYTVFKAIELFIDNSASSLGFGATIEHITQGSNRKVMKFRKSPYTCLSAEARKVLRQIRVSEEQYRQSFPSDQQSGFPQYSLTISDEHTP